MEWVDGLSEVTQQRSESWQCTLDAAPHTPHKVQQQDRKWGPGLQAAWLEAMAEAER